MQIPGRAGSVLDDGAGAAIAHAEALGRDTPNIDFTRCGAVENDVTGDDVLFRLEGTLLRWVEDDLAAGQALA